MQELRMASLTKVALIEDLSDNQFFQQYAFTREDGATGRIELRPSDANRWTTFRDQLRNRNAHASVLNKATIEGAIGSTPKRRLAYAPATGWRRGNKTFVLPDRAVGTNSKSICGLPTIDRGGYFGSRGTCKSWLRQVGPVATKSSAIMLAASCSFAAPLLRIMNEQSFGICLVGKTGGGKTTAALVASSIYRSGQIDQLLSWYATAAGLEPVLRSHNDCLLVVDDLNKMPLTSDRERHETIKSFSYNIGSTKLRSPLYDESSDNGEQYRVIALTSAETAIAELAARRGNQRGGDARRLIDVPVYFNGISHIFDRVPDPHKLSQTEQQLLFSSTHAACAKNYGLLFTAYLKFLIKSQLSLPQRIVTLQKQFCAKMPNFSQDVVSTDIVRKFGLIYAGGALAIEGVALPWKRKDLLQAIVRSCTAALDTIFPELKILDEGWKSLRSKLMALPRRASIGRSEYSSIDGYVELQSRRYRCVIKTDKFNRTFANQLQRKLVMNELIRRGYISHSRSNGNQAQFTWPDGVRRRSLEINWRPRVIAV
jgi:hypothetical protein